VLDRFDFILRMRVKGPAATLGWVFLGVLGCSLLLFLLWGNGKVSRVLFFPSRSGGRMVAEERLLSRRGSLALDVTELAEGILLGSTRHDAVRIFPRGARARSALVSGRTLSLDLSSDLLAADAEAPLRGQDTLDALARSLRYNFPRLAAIDFFIDGQKPRFLEKKKI